ncbi:MAG: hypothetical protein AABX38_06760 [Candidatus Micrarchaeota archaeon]
MVLLTREKLRLSASAARSMGLVHSADKIEAVANQFGRFLGKPMADVSEIKSGLKGVRSFVGLELNEKLQLNSIGQNLESRNMAHERADQIRAELARIHEQL